MLVAFQDSVSGSLCKKRMQLAAAEHKYDTNLVFLFPMPSDRDEKNLATLEKSPLIMIFISEFEILCSIH